MATFYRPCENNVASRHQHREFIGMEAKFKLSDKFTLKTAQTFTRSFPMGGYNKDGSVGEGDKVHVRGGSVGTIADVHDFPGHNSVAWYIVDFDDEASVHLDENQLLELCEPV
jgi:hypothetical protein